MEDEDTDMNIPSDADQDDPLIVYDELSMCGQTPDLEAFCARYPGHPALRERILRLQRLHGRLDLLHLVVHQRVLFLLQTLQNLLEDAYFVLDHLYQFRNQRFHDRDLLGPFGVSTGQA